MEWINRLEASLNYIEDQLTTEIEPQKLAQIAGCSYYHYQRIFSYMVGMPLAEYIRKRKLSAASINLQQKEKVIDVALKYGYESPTAFARAFKKQHGVIPSEAQKEGVLLKTYPRIKFNITIKGDVEMEYRIETKEAFEITGVGKNVGKTIEENQSGIPQFWNQVAMDGTLEKLAPLMNGTPQGLLGVGEYGEYGETKEVYFFIGVANEAKVPNDFETYTVGAFTWAIFSGSGPMPQAMQDLGERIMTEWLPTSGYEYDKGPDIELYLDANPADAKFEVWIPVVKK